MNFKNLLFVFFMLATTIMVAQTTIISDNEPGDTTHVFAFGNGHFSDSTFTVVANPTPNGVNSSANVHSWCEAHDGNGYAGFGYKVETLDFTGDVAEICISVLITHSAKIRIKSTGSTTGGPQIRIEKDYSTPNEWQQICFDFANDPDINGNVGLAMSHLYSRFDIYVDYNVDITEDDCYYFDDILIHENGIGLYVDPDQNMISDNEPGDDTQFLPFANGHLGDSTFTVVPNPNKTGIDTSANAHAWCRANDASAWASFYLNMDTIDCTGDKAEICINILADHDATFDIKIKNSATGPDVVIKKEYTTPGEWQQICFDFANDEDKNGDVGAAMGAIYTQVVFYFNYGINQTDDDCYFFDNFLINENGDGILPALIENKINENSELSDFKAYVTAIDLWGELNKAGVTVFAPTNAAFAALPAAEKTALDDNTDNATYNMVLHHLTYDSLPADLLTDGLVYHTRNGQDGTVAGNTVNGGNVSASEVATNGFLHVLDAVMTYPEWPEEFLYADFEGNGDASDFDGWWNWGTAGLPSFATIANPYKDATNPSDNVMEYKRYPKNVVVDGVDKTTLWYQGIKHLNARPYNFYGPMTDVCVDIYAPDGDHYIFLKLAGAVTPNGKSGFLVPYVGGSWQTVCFDATASDWYDDTRTAENNIFPANTWMFDTDVSGVWPADTAVFYLDNWRTRNVLVGLNNISKLENFEMSPNPASDYLDINADTPIQAAVVYDVTGKVMLRVTDPVHNNLDVRQLTTGIYFIKFIGFDGQNQGAVKFVKQ